MRRVLHFLKKELIELRADPRLFGIVIMAPIIQLTVLGYAATTDVKDVPLLVVDGDRSTESRRLIDRFDASANFKIVDVVSGSNDIEPHLEHGSAWMALTIPAGFGADVAAARRTTVQVIADGTDSNSTTVALGYARGVVAGYSTDRLAERLPGGLRAAPIDADIRVWFNPRLESREFMVPGIIALLLLVVTTNLTAMAIVREREVGTLEQLNVTPLARWELIVGKLLPYALIGLLDVLLVTAVAVFWFEIPLRGSFLLLFGVQPALSAVDPRPGPVREHHLAHPAAGVDDDDVLLPDADDLPVGIHLPDREHAAVDPVRDLRDPAALLPGDRPRHLPEGRRRRRAVAADGGAAGVRAGAADPGHAAIEQAPGVASRRHPDG